MVEKFQAFFTIYSFESSFREREKGIKMGHEEGEGHFTLFSFSLFFLQQISSIFTQKNEF